MVYEKYIWVCSKCLEKHWLLRRVSALGSIVDVGELRCDHVIVRDWACIVENITINGEVIIWDELEIF